ncbi:leukocyte antigen CD37 [Engraulis encrasicolus]|uniref:leukocyte antigen CD37 n=1 Tax=Engraulis encrasicolus TaxID=184585 RepID=UPI002FD531FE
MLMLSLGVWITWAESSFFMEPPSFMSMSLLSTSLVIAGSLSTALGFLGCMGAVQEAKCMLGLYFMLLTILLAAQCVGGVLFVTQRDLFESSLMDHMSGVIQLYGKNESHLRHFEKTLDYIQEEVGCCGWESHFDWDSAPCSCYYFNSSHHASPNATTSTASTATTLPCGCKGRDLSRTTQCAIYKQGCRRQVEEWMDDHMLTILVVIFALIAVEISGMILSMCLYRSHSKDELLTFY